MKKIKIYVLSSIIVPTWTFLLRTHELSYCRLEHCNACLCVKITWSSFILVKIMGINHVFPSLCNRCAKMEIKYSIDRGSYNFYDSKDNNKMVFSMSKTHKYQRLFIWIAINWRWLAMNIFQMYLKFSIVIRLSRSFKCLNAFTCSHEESKRLCLFEKGFYL